MKIKNLAGEEIELDWAKESYEKVAITMKEYYEKKMYRDVLLVLERLNSLMRAYIEKYMQVNCGEDWLKISRDNVFSRG